MITATRYTMLMYIISNTTKFNKFKCEDSNHEYYQENQTKVKINTLQYLMGVNGRCSFMTSILVYIYYYDDAGSPTQYKSDTKIIQT